MTDERLAEIEHQSTFEYGESDAYELCDELLQALIAERDHNAELEKKIEYLCLDQENYEPILVAENQRLKAKLDAAKNVKTFGMEASGSSDGTYRVVQWAKWDDVLEALGEAK